ncbi:MAG: sigma-70 family RNA polymerase sigma factor [Solirubrobacteraceae bacterium]|nr:sigma-70 family RNA polymerase sigma factor [Solirubrobacteraceae bacterium]
MPPPSVTRHADERSAQAVRRYERPLQRYAAKMLRGTGIEPEDVVQEVFLRAHAAFAEDQEIEDLKPWLYRLTRNRVIDELRARKLVTPLEDAEPAADDGDPVVVLAQRERLHSVVADVSALPDAQRAVLLGREIDGRTHEELAAELGLTTSATRMLMNRARTNLMKAAAAREADCDAIRDELLTAHDEGTRPSEHARRHLKGCSACQEFQRDLKRLRRSLRVFDPSVAVVAGGGGLSLAALFGGGASTTVKVTAAVVGAAVLTAGAAGIVSTRVIGDDEPLPRAVPGGPVVAGQRLHRGDRVPAGWEVVDRVVRVPAAPLVPPARVTKFSLGCRPGFVVAAVAPTEGAGFDEGVFGPQLVDDPSVLGRATSVTVAFRRPASPGSGPIDIPIGVLCKPA